MQNFKTPDFIKRHPGNPILDAGKVPYNAVQVFNAGFAKYNGKYVCIFRVFNQLIIYTPFHMTLNNIKKRVTQK